MHLIGIHGKARSGKDTVAKYLVNEHGYVKSAFADPVKRAAAAMFGLSEEETFSDELKEVVIPYWGMSPRQMFQKVGTEGGRDVFGDDLWLRRWMKFYDEYHDVSSIVVSDLRFDNEADLIRERGGLVLHLTSNRPSALTTTAAAHASEAGIKFVPGDHRIHNDGSFQALYAKVDQLLVCLEDQGRGAVA